MDIAPLLPSAHVLIGLNGESRRAILEALVEPLRHSDAIADMERFLEELEVREGQVTTLIPGGIAFPHARCAGVRRLVMVVGTAPPPGLPFGGTDRERCRLFFLMAVPPSAPTAHLPLLKHVSAFVRQDARMARLLSARTSAQAARLLCTFKP